MDKMSIIENLHDLEEPKDIGLSPDGQQVIYATALRLGQKKGEHNVSTIWIAETGKQKSARQLTSGLFNDASPKWSPDGETIAFVSDRAKAGERRAIYVLSPKGGEAYPVTSADSERAISKFEWSPDGKFIAFLSADEKTAEKKAKEKEKDDVQVWGEEWEFNRLRLLHVKTKKVTPLVVKDAHVVDLAWNDDSSAIAYITYRTPNVESPYLHGTTFERISVISKETSMIVKHPGYARELYWCGATIYFQGGVEKTCVNTSSCIYRIALDKTQGASEPAKIAHGDEDCAAGLHKVGPEMLVKVEHDLEDQIRILDGRTLFSRKQMILSWDAKFMTDSDEIVLAIATGTVSTPTEVYTVTASGGAMVQLSDHGHAFAGKPLGTCTFLSCQSADGEVILDGLYLTPHKHAREDGTPKTPLPTAVLIHGGPYSRNTDSFDPVAFYLTPLLLAAGYGCLVPNYRGGSGRGEKFAAYARGGLGQYDQPDTISLTQLGIEKGYADREKLLVGGWSQGGFLSFLNAVRNGMHGLGWQFKASIPGAGVSDWDAMAFTSDVGSFQAELAGRSPWRADKDDTSGRRGSALWEFAKAARAGVVPPMLILHGEKDERVPITQAWGIRRAMTDYNLPCEMATYPREGHVVMERKHLDDMLARIQRFCDTHLA